MGIKLKIEKIVAGGYGLARENGKIYLVRGAYTGEDVEVSIEKDGKDVALCRVEKIKHASQKRQKPICEHFGVCGGCDWMDLDYETQLEYKKEIFVDQIKHVAKVDVTKPAIIKTSPYGYRNKAEFVIKDGKLGYNSKNSHNFVEIKRCHIISDKLNEMKGKVEKVDLKDFHHIVLREDGNKEMVIFVSQKKCEIPEIDADEIISLVNRKHVVVSGEESVKKGKGFLIVKMDDIKYRLSAKAFFQISYEGAKILSQKVKEYAGSGKRLLDLYCGTGFFTLELSKNFEKLTGIEESSASISNANENAKSNGISNVEFFSSKVENFKFGTYDVIVADPPRAGIGKEIIQSIVQANPERFVYVSCDVTTFARDTHELEQKRYKIKDVTLVDLFPQTHHFEIVSLFERE